MIESVPPKAGGISQTAFNTEAGKAEKYLRILVAKQALSGSGFQARLQSNTYGLGGSGFERHVKNREWLSRRI